MLVAKWQVVRRWDEPSGRTPYDAHARVCPAAAMSSVGLSPCSKHKGFNLNGIDGICFNTHISMSHHNIPQSSIYF